MRECVCVCVRERESDRFIYTQREWESDGQIDSGGADVLLPLRFNIWCNNDFLYEHDSNFISGLLRCIQLPFRSLHSKEKNLRQSNRDIVSCNSTTLNFATIQTRSLWSML